MKVIRKSLLSGAHEAEGLPVVIDVLRAFTCEAILFARGVERVILVASPEEALELKQKYHYLAIGEVRGASPQGFDFGNSPNELLKTPPGYFHNQTVVHRSSAGTQGAIAACECSEQIVLGSYVMAKSIATYIRQNPHYDTVTLIGMGAKLTETAVEDEACADYIQHLLLGTSYNHAETLWKCLNDSFIQRCLHGEAPHEPPEDVFLCLQRDLYDFVLIAEKVDQHIVVRKMDIK